MTTRTFARDEKGGMLVALDCVALQHVRRRAMTERSRRDKAEPERETPPDLDDSTAYGATEREQTRDVRSRNPRGDADVDLGGVSEDLEQNSDSPAD
jgi:hypothetical protein